MSVFFVCVFVFLFVFFYVLSSIFSAARSDQKASDSSFESSLHLAEGFFFRFLIFAFVRAKNRKNIIFPRFFTVEGGKLMIFLFLGDNF